MPNPCILSMLHDTGVTAKTDYDTGCDIGK
jgi:hypothetical protein